MLEGRGRRLRISENDLALQRRIEQIRIAVDLDVADQIGVDHDDRRHAVKAGQVAFHVLVFVVERILVHAGIILEILAAVLDSADRAGPENVALRLLAFSRDALERVARAHRQALGLDAGIRLKHRQHVFDHGRGQRAVQNQLAGRRRLFSHRGSHTAHEQRAQQHSKDPLHISLPPVFFADDSVRRLLVLLYMRVA